MAKLIKDVVHGYIEFDQEYIDIINSSEFQRLRNIRQTSYNSLYPSSLHDRFSHSLGVFAFGKYAFYNFKKNVEQDFSLEVQSAEIDWAKKENLFLSACLLHDIGHSPFSHTGEDFYLLKRDSNSSLARDQYIYAELVKAVGQDEFKNDFNETQLKNGNAAKPHEIISAIVGIKKFLQDKTADDKSLFARMIIGLRYKSANSISTGIDNALIQLLNSSVIDVDRLDYLARDRLMTGFESARIDTDRLLASVCLINNSSDETKPNYQMGYYKNALSVIESVIVAHDGERKWIQGHPVVLYDSFLVQKLIEAVESTYGNNIDIFCEESLLEDGICISDNTGSSLMIRYLSDADILFLSKQIPCESEYREFVDEYFSRDKRKKAIWKSEAEYDLMLRELGDSDRKRVIEWLASLINDLIPYGDRSDATSVIINDNVENKVNEDNQKKAQLGDIEARDSKRFAESILKKMNILKEMAKEFNVPYNFVLSYTKAFDSNAKKLISNDVLIKYKNFEFAKPVGDIISTYTLNEHSVLKKEANKMIFFMFYYKTGGNSITPLGFINYLKDAIR